MRTSYVAKNHKNSLQSPVGCPSWLHHQYVPSNWHQQVGVKHIVLPLTLYFVFIYDRHGRCQESVVCCGESETTNTDLDKHVHVTSVVTDDQRQERLHNSAQFPHDKVTQ